MTSAHWKRVSVSAFLRYEYYHPSIFRGIPGVIHLQGVRTPDAEEAILDSIVDLYYDRIPPEVRRKPHQPVWLELLDRGSFAIPAIAQHHVIQP
jgi:hypothetical protein